MNLSPYDYESILSQDYTKLKDILVSLPVFNQTVSAFEGMAGFYLKRTAVDKKGNTRDVTATSYVVPYVYIYPIIASMIRLFDKTYDEIENNPTMKKLWIDNVRDRALPYVEHALNESEVDAFDSDDDAGVLVHVLTGKMTRFHYSKITDVKFVHIHNDFGEMLDLVRRSADGEMTHKDVCKLINLQNEDSYRTISIMTYNDTDPYNPSGLPTLESTNEQATLPLKVLDLLDEGILNAMKEKRKVIITA